MINKRAARLLRAARRRAGLSQRELAARSGVPQPTIAAIETGRQDPRSLTLMRLLDGCDHEVEVTPKLGIGVDRSLIQEQLRLTPTQRAARAAQGARWLDTLRRARRV